MAAAAEPTNAPPRTDYSSFRLVSERNIFNGSRAGRWTPPPPSEERRSSRVDAFTLVGTISYGKGPFAFFNGTSSEYRKVLPPGGTIAGHRIAEITREAVRLEADTNRLELKVGMELRREDQGPWQVRESAETYASTSRGSGFGRDESRGFDSRRGDSRGESRGFDSRRGESRAFDSRGFDSRRGESRGSSSSDTARSGSSSSPASTGPALSSEQESEILKRLMQQREQEGK